MSTYPSEAVEAAANRLMNTLALHEDARGTVTDFLHDMWDAGRDTTAALALAPARLIHDDARALVNRSAVLTRTAHLRILANTDKLLDALCAPAAPCNVCGEPGQSIDDGTGQPYVLCDEDDQAHAAVREGITRMQSATPDDNPRAPYLDGHDGSQD